MQGSCTTDTFISKFEECLKKGDVEAAELYFLEEAESEAPDISTLFSAAKPASLLVFVCFPPRRASRPR